ncbi:hypothetical protein EV643_1643 [Kribbella sp. VKM Ac-2527]|uniref:Uncharacterized protein n=1 Tax=Kribbella caucasensis TaxID=2512215 RepID=A0A4R6IWZ1_9ACTN|nr:hypothetical protein [Kribbella sp. VKM Ac-2527]TDO27243.1 hypothetical protein EV643_1643 [Kribbella sp. VKM Ac-2527]
MDDETDGVGEMESRLIDDEYSTDTTVRIHEIEQLSDKFPKQSWSFTLPGSLSVRDVKTLFVAPGQYDPPYALDKNYRSLEWGASGAETEFLIQLGSDLSSGLLLAALAQLAKRARQQLGGHPLDDESLTRDGAHYRATYALAMAYEIVVREDLRVVSESQSSSPLTYSFQFTNGEHQFEADVTLTDQGVAVTRVKWIRDGTSS